MATDISRYGPWRGVQHSVVREGFEAFRKVSPFPERFEGVAQGVKPPQDREFWIIKKKISADPRKRRELSIDPTKHNDCWVACNLCGPQPKFKGEGCLILDEFGWLYLIGPDCGEKHYQYRFVDEDRRFDEAEERRRAYNYLWSNIHAFAEWKNYAERLKAHAETASKVQGVLRKSPTVTKELRQAFNNENGWLSIFAWQERRNKNLDLVRVQVRERFAKIRGRAAVYGKGDVLARLNQAWSVFDRLGTEESAFEVMAEAEDAGALHKLANAVREAFKEIDAIRIEIVQIRLFFSEENFKIIVSWSRRPDCPIHLDAHYNGSARLLKLSGSKERQMIDVTELLQPVPKLPHLPL